MPPKLFKLVQHLPTGLGAYPLSTLDNLTSYSLNPNADIFIPTHTPLKNVFCTMIFFLQLYLFYLHLFYLI